MNVEIGTETPIFLFWEYLFRNFDIVCLKCGIYYEENEDGGRDEVILKQY
jgi:hypothetical protein